MVSFARARAKSWLTRLWPAKVKTNKNETAEMDMSRELIENQQKQNKCLLKQARIAECGFPKSLTKAVD